MDEGSLATQLPAGAGPSRKSFIARLGGVFISPGSTFEDIARAPDFIAPLVTIILVSVAVTETMLRKIGMARIVQISLQQSGRAENMSADQMQAAIQRGATFGAILARVGAVIGYPIILLIIAGIGLLILNAFFGAEAKFGGVFSAVCYASMLVMVRSLLTVPVFLFGDPNQLNFQNPAPTNLGFFLNPLETSKPLYALAGSLDIFTFWYLVVLAIGLARVGQNKVKASWIFGCYFGLWLIYTLCRAALAML